MTRCGGGRCANGGDGGEIDDKGKEHGREKGTVEYLMCGDMRKESEVQMEEGNRSSEKHRAGAASEADVEQKMGGNEENMELESSGLLTRRSKRKNAVAATQSRIGQLSALYGSWSRLMAWWMYGGGCMETPGNIHGPI
ncbi:hypothetical protein CRENBAI_024239 [Crenichthys baileyi]|uniref:Uncharacterized protein n=1 Tax=Crenichthys baileyi TaxID=28760 RepID=A0AAV9RBR5_9TELE